MNNRTTQTHRLDVVLTVDLPRDLVDRARRYLDKHTRIDAYEICKAIVDAADNPTNICANYSCDAVHPACNHDEYLARYDHARSCNTCTVLDRAPSAHIGI